MKLYNLLIVMYLLLAATSCGKSNKLSHPKIAESGTNWRQVLHSFKVAPSQSIDTLSTNVFTTNYSSIFYKQ